MKFLWGAATAGHQIDGQNVHSDWWHWENTRVADGHDHSGLATDHRKYFREDLAEAAALGMNTYRFSFEWCRFQPSEGLWDDSAEAWYDELLTECERLGLVPMATLHHFSLPKWFADQGGFASPQAAEKFLLYVKKIVKRFGARIPLWCTINEPIVLVAGSYIAQYMPPAKHDPSSASKACYQLLRSHVLAYDAIHQLTSERTGPFKEMKLMVGFAHNMQDFQAARSWHPIEWAIAKALHQVYNCAWLNGVTGQRARFGLPGVFPYAPEVKEARGRVTADFIGVNYYTKARVHWRPKENQGIDFTPGVPIGINFSHPDDEVSDMGWSLHPAGFEKILKLAARYERPIFITENGIADGADRLRTRYLLEHLSVIAKFIANKVEILGYYHWSLLDNFEWSKGFAPRFGLISVDYKTLVRKRTASAEVYRKVIESHKVGDHGPQIDLLQDFI